MAIIRWAPGVLPEPWFGRVSWVADGDTVRSSGDSGRRWVRLWGIDAPECGQAWFLESKAKLIELVWGKVIAWSPVSMDKYRRVVCRLVAPGGVDVGRAMLECGLAWWEPKWAVNDEVLHGAQTVARAARVGIWSTDNWGWAPWVWRHRARVGG
jgi:micrococcal nuclease